MMQLGTKQQSLMISSNDCIAEIWAEQSQVHAYMYIICETVNC